MAAKSTRAEKARQAAQSAGSNPYVRRLIEDEDLRRSVKEAFDAARHAYQRMSNGKGPQAVDALVQAKDRFASDPIFQYALATTAMNAGRNTEAAGALRQVLVLNPENAEAHYYLGSLLVGENKVPQAIAELEKYLSMSGQNPENLDTAKALLAALKARK